MSWHIRYQDESRIYLLYMQCRYKKVAFVDIIHKINLFKSRM